MFFLNASGVLTLPFSAVTPRACGDATTRRVGDISLASKSYASADWRLSVSPAGAFVPVAVAVVVVVVVVGCVRFFGPGSDSGCATVLLGVCIVLLVVLLVLLSLLLLLLSADLVSSALLSRPTWLLRCCVRPSARGGVRFCTAEAAAAARLLGLCPWLGPWPLCCLGERRGELAGAAARVGVAVALLLLSPPSSLTASAASQNRMRGCAVAVAPVVTGAFLSCFCCSLCSCCCSCPCPCSRIFFVLCAA